MHVAVEVACARVLVRDMRSCSHIVLCMQAQLAAQELARYEQEKVEQRLWVAAFSAVGAVSTYAAYSREVCFGCRKSGVSA
jgi:hypothetical protein